MNLVQGGNRRSDCRKRGRFQNDGLPAVAKQGGRNYGCRYDAGQTGNTQVHAMGAHHVMIMPDRLVLQRTIVVC